jgi:hypothetical protein
MECIENNGSCVVSMLLSSNDCLPASQFCLSTDMSHCSFLKVICPEQPIDVLPLTSFLIWGAKHPRVVDDPTSPALKMCAVSSFAWVVASSSTIS